MCSDSYSRQRTAVELAQRADVVILLDDGGGAAQSVFEVCSRVNDRVHRVRSKEEIKPAWFDGAGTAAIIGGILAPAGSVEGRPAFLPAPSHQPAALYSALPGPRYERHPQLTAT